MFTVVLTCPKEQEKCKLPPEVCWHIGASISNGSWLSQFLSEFLTDLKIDQIVTFLPLPPHALPLQELVDELYNFRDCYFETRGVEEAGRKQSDVAKEIEKTLKKLEEKEGECCIHTTALQPLICIVSVTPTVMSVFFGLPQITLNTKQSSCCRRAGVWTSLLTSVPWRRSAFPAPWSWSLAWWTAGTR